MHHRLSKLVVAVPSHGAYPKTPYFPNPQVVMCGTVMTIENAIRNRAHDYQALWHFLAASAQLLNQIVLELAMTQRITDILVSEEGVPFVLLKETLEAFEAYGSSLKISMARFAEGTPEDADTQEEIHNISKPQEYASSSFQRFVNRELADLAVPLTQRLKVVFLPKLLQVMY